MDFLTKGKVWKFGDNIDTDVITPGKYLNLEMEELKLHVLEPLNPRFAKDAKRGDIIVFRTDGIPSCPPGTFYVKRLVGLPGDKISIQAPHVVINGEKLVDPPIFKKIAEGQDGYEPFCLPAGSFPGTLFDLCSNGNRRA